MADSLIREIDGAVKADKWRDLWQQFGKTMVWITSAILLLTIGYVWFDGMRENYQQNITSSILTAQNALVEENPNKAIRVLEAAIQESAPIGASESSLRTLALLQLSALPNHNKNHNAHIDTHSAALQTSHGKVIAHPNTDPALQQLWQLQALQHAAQNDPSSVPAELMHMPKGGPFSSLIRELQAIILSYSGDQKAAHDILSSLSLDESLPKTQRDRVVMLLSQIVPTDAETITE